jgi:hypothetical protein
MPIFLFVTVVVTTNISINNKGTPVASTVAQEKTQLPSFQHQLML